MQSGDYNQPFEIAKLDYATDLMGNQIPNYETVYRGFAKVNNLSGKEYWDALSVENENVVKFYCRWHRKLAGLDTRDHVIFWQDKVMDILAIDNVSYKNAQCVIKAKEDMNAKRKD